MRRIHLEKKREKPIEKPGFRSGCLCCGVKSRVIDGESVLAVGFGGVTVTKDNHVLWSGDDCEETLEKYELIAQKDPDHDYRGQYCGPLSGSTYQRHGKNQWVLIAEDRGFA